MGRITAGTLQEPGSASIGDSLREARNLKNYSLEDLAITTGLTVAEITDVESGSSTFEPHLERIRHALN